MVVPVNWDAQFSLFGQVLFGLCAMQVVVTTLCKVIPGPQQEKPGVAAFEIICLPVCCWLGYYGLVGHLDAVGGANYDGTLSMAKEHLLTEVPDMVTINVVLAAYSAWGTAVVVALPPLRVFSIIFHHASVCATCWLVLASGFAHHYGFFFSGVQEISSAVLCFVDIMKEFPVLKRNYPTTFFVFKGVFGLTFISIRNIYWPVHSFRLWYDYYLLWASGLADIAGVPLLYIAPVFAGWASITYLQCLWGRIIVNNSCSALGIPPPFPFKAGTNGTDSGYDDEPAEKKKKK